MSWESTAEYYRFVNEAVRQRLGGLHSADCLLRSVDFADVEHCSALRTGTPPASSWRARRRSSWQPAPI
jgi:aspartate/glutamate racemase